MAQAFSFLQPDQNKKPALPWGATYDPQTTNDLPRRQIGATDIQFEGPTREAARIALQKSMSGENPEDAAANDAIRSAFGERLQALNGQQATRKGQVESELAQGFKNQVAELRRQAGGTGTMGSSTMGTQVGDIASQYQDARAKALSDLESQGLDELGKIQSGLGGAYGQNLTERQFQLGQGQDLSNLLMQQVAGDQAREGNLAALNQADQASQRKFWSDLITGVAAAGGTAAAGRK